MYEDPLVLTPASHSCNVGSRVTVLAN